MYSAMMRSFGLGLLLSIGTLSTALAQSATPTGSATPTTGDVGSATLRNGFPVGGGAVALPSAQSSGTTSTPAAGTANTSSTNSTTSTGSTSSGGSGSGAGGSGQTGGVGGGTGRGGGGSASTAGAATASGSTGSGTHWVLCPPSGAPGLEPLFTGTDLSCAPQ